MGVRVLCDFFGVENWGLMLLACFKYASFMHLGRSLEEFCRMLVGVGCEGSGKRGIFACKDVGRCRYSGWRGRRLLWVVYVAGVRWVWGIRCV